MKILICSNQLWSIYNFRIGLIKMLIARGHTVSILAPRDYSIFFLEKIGCNVFSIDIDRKSKNPLKDFILLCRIYLSHRKLKPDLVINYTIKFVIYGSIAARFSKIKSVAVITGLGSSYIEGGLTRMVVFGLYRIALSGIYKIIFLNSADLEIFISNKLVRDSNAKLLNGEGVNLKYFSTNLSVAQSDGITFLLVARMLWDKGVGEYVEAAKKVKEKFPNAVFQLLGPIDAQNPTSIPHSQIDNWMRDEVVDYLGVHDDVRPFIASADCIVLPSYREGMSRVLMEACSMGRPIIATNVPGCSEIVEDGVTGFLCKPRDPIDLEKKIQMMMHLSSSDRLLMGKRAVKRAVDLFDENIINSKFIEFIEC